MVVSVLALVSWSTMIMCPQIIYKIIYNNLLFCKISGIPLYVQVAV